VPFKKVDRPCNSATDNRVNTGKADIRPDPVAMIPAHDLGPPICERFVGTCRRGVLDHLLIFSARHLEAVIKEFLVHYHQARPHQGLDQGCPAPAEHNVVPLPMYGQIVRHDRLGGLLHGAPG